MKLVLALLALVSIALCAPGHYESVDSRYFPEETDPYRIKTLTYRDRDGNLVVEDLTKPVTFDENEDFAANITFILTTRDNRDDYEIIHGNNFSAILSSTKFNPKKKTVLLSHGWLGNREQEEYGKIIKAFLDNNDVNCFAIDWSGVAGKFYTVSRYAVPGIGKVTGEFINYLIKTYNISSKLFSLYGFSLGAHVVGSAGAVVKAKSGLVSLIYALDAASPLFDVSNLTQIVDKTDAETVHAIHTEGTLLGLRSSIGHVDFFPNDGDGQPGCFLDFFGICAHNRVLELIEESLGANNLTAYKCKDYNTFSLGKCFNNVATKMGGFIVNKSVRGNFYLDTNSDSPYGQGPRK